MAKALIIFLMSVLFCIDVNASSAKRSNLSRSDRDDYVLMLDFYRATNEWANGIDDNITKALTNKNKKFFLKNMFDATTDNNKFNPNWWNIYFSDIPQNKPKIILVLGDAGWILYHHYVPRSWRNIPCIVLPARSNIVPFGSFSHNIVISDQNQIPFFSTTKGFKVVGLNHGHYAKETIELMQKLQPELKQIMFISDSRLSSAFVKYNMQNTVRQSFPNLKYISYERKNHTAQQLLDTLQRLDKKTGLIFYGWSDPNTNAENADYIKKMISAYSHVPVFTLSDDKTIRETSLCGGYYNSAEDIAKAVVEMIKRYDEHKSVPWGHTLNIMHAKAYLNYVSLLDKHIDTSLIPNDAVVYGKPVTFIQKFKTQIILSVSCLIVLFVLLLAYAWSQRKMKMVNANVKTELEHMNHILKVVVDASNVFPWFIDLQAGTFSAFDKVLTIEQFLKYIHPDDVHKYAETIDSLIKDHNRQTFSEHEARILIEEGPYHWYKLRGVVDKRDENGNPIYIIGSAENIDKQRQIEEYLVETKEKAIESNNLKTAFLANMSHEIRTPLNAIVGYADLLVTSDDLSQEDKEIFNRNISSNKEQLMQLFNDILDLSKIEAGILELKFSMIDFTEMVNLAVASAQFNISRNDKGVELIKDQMPSSFMTCSDGKRIQQVIVNFLNNAFKFTKEGSIHVGYSVQGDGHIYCYVKDTGIGIEKSKQDIIFERFEKLDIFKPGTGLGLSISKMIIEKLHGQIGLESEVGRGSLFWFTLPVAAESSAS